MLCKVTIVFGGIAPHQLRGLKQGRSIIQKYYPEPKKRETSGIFLWSKVLLDKGITNRTIGQSLRVDFPKSKPSLYKSKKGRETLIYWPSCPAGDGLLATASGFGFDVAACAQPCLRRGIHVRPCSLRLCVYLPCGLQVQPLD